MRKKVKKIKKIVMNKHLGAAIVKPPKKAVKHQKKIIKKMKREVYKIQLNNLPFRLTKLIKLVLLKKAKTPKNWNNLRLIVDWNKVKNVVKKLQIILKKKMKRKIAVLIKQNEK